MAQNDSVMVVPDSVTIRSLFLVFFNPFFITLILDFFLILVNIKALINRWKINYHNDMQFLGLM
jgi:hypothetical protein